MSELTAEEQAAAAAAGAAAGDDDDDDEGGAPAAAADAAAAPAPAPAGKKAGKGKGASDDAATAAAVAAVVDAPAPRAPIVIQGRAVPATVDAVAAHFQAWVARGPAASGGLATAAELDGARARAAAATSLSSAVAANFVSVRDAIKQPVLPDIPAWRRVGAADPAGLGVVIAEESSFVAGARVTVTITRAPGAWPALKSIESLVPAGAGSASSSARAAALAVICAVPGAGLPRAGGAPTRYDGVALSLTEGVHVFASPEGLLASATPDAADLLESAASSFPGSSLLAAAVVAAGVRAN